jgi:hypothetical protein
MQDEKDVPKGSIAGDRSPPVTSFSWGRIEADGKLFRDARLFPGGAEAWDWEKTGTHHKPGIQLADVEDLLALGPKTVILSRGMDLVLEVPAATVAVIRARGPQVLVLQSKEAVEEYNRRCLLEPVVALIHSTC